MATIVVKQIKVSDKTYKELSELGKFNQSFNDVITMLLSDYKERHSKK
jgi:predicted CopG family antitoxin